MDERKKVLKDIEELQSECTHKEGYDVKFKSNTIKVRCICKICQKVIGYPSEQDLRDNGFI